jgi:hypothetical protein
MSYFFPPPAQPYKPPPPPPNNYGANRQLQGTLSIGSNTLITCPQGYICIINLRFNNPVAYDITLSITRGPENPTPGTLQCYSLTLAAGDTVEDQGYVLKLGDSVTVDTTVAGTNYFMGVKYTPGR